MVKRRVVTHLTIEQYMAAKASETSATTSPFRYNTATRKVKVDMEKLRRRVASAAKSSKVVRMSERAITIDELNR